MEEVINLVDKFSSQILLIQVGLILILLSIFAWVWFFNKRKYNHLKHQIPATVVKDYLDSIIQNSTALKSSLFRGGGLDVDLNSVPSVLKFQEIATGSTSVSYASNNDSEELNAKNAEIMKLREELSNKENTIKDLDKEMTSLNGEVKAKDEKIAELEALLGSGGGDGDSSEMLNALRKERDEYKERLDEYAIIEDDLAHLKKLKEENAMLKASLEGGSTEAPQAAAQEESPVEKNIVEEQRQSAQEEPEPVVQDEAFVEDEELEAMEQALSEEFAEAAAAEEAPPQEAASEEVVEEVAEDKSAEDLLSEFEKMLG